VDLVVLRAQSVSKSPANIDGKGAERAREGRENRRRGTHSNADVAVELVAFGVRNVSHGFGGLREEGCQRGGRKAGRVEPEAAARL
jgi:hypothetical protein